mmetsp:Transcript_68743/g.212553  ORF Transcript_68743/g.212553 Transcript_68743/m.212553 type:complete len:280 (-) Transcript_68743:496-1335(-)
MAHVALRVGGLGEGTGGSRTRDSRGRPLGLRGLAVRPTGVLARDEVQGGLEGVAEARTLLRAQDGVRTGGDALADEEGAVGGLELEPWQRRLGGLVVGPEDLHQPSTRAAVPPHHDPAVLLRRRRLQVEDAARDVPTLPYPALQALPAPPIADVPLGHGEHLDGEGPLGDDIQDGKPRGVHLCVLDDAQPLVGEAPPERERGPSEGHDEQKLLVAMGKAGLYPALQPVDQPEVRHLEQRQVDLYEAGGGRHPKLGRRPQAAADVPGLEEFCEAACVDVA